MKNTIEKIESMVKILNSQGVDSVGSIKPWEKLSKLTAAFYKKCNKKDITNIVNLLNPNLKIVELSEKPHYGVASLSNIYDTKSLKTSDTCVAIYDNKLYLDLKRKSVWKIKESV